MTRKLQWLYIFLRETKLTIKNFFPKKTPSLQGCTDVLANIKEKTMMPNLHIPFQKIEKASNSLYEQKIIFIQNIF